MIDKNEVAAFFDSYAEGWDRDLIVKQDVMDIILDAAGVTRGSAVLDVGCGTGVMIEQYLRRNAGWVTGIDISPNMAAIARAKFPEENVEILCADAETQDFWRQYDCAVIYNAFPHFASPDRLFSHLASFLKPGGTLTVAHNMSRAQIDSHHSGVQHVSNGLMEAEELAGLMASYVTITRVISDDNMYLVSGRKG